MSEVATAEAFVHIDDQPWPEIELPPTDLPYDDGAKMETSWHADAGPLLKASIIAAHGGQRQSYYVANNMFVYYSLEQVRNKDYRGPDVFFVKDVDGTRYRHSWIAWVEGGRLPDVIFELLSDTTQREDVGVKKQLYEQVFRTSEYFCIGFEVDRLLGWRLVAGKYVPIELDEHGRLWSDVLGVWIGPWKGSYMAEEHTWPRFYDAHGQLVLLPDEAERQRAEAAQAQAEAAQAQTATERQRAETERQRAEELAARVAELETELKRLRGDQT